MRKLLKYALITVVGFAFISIVYSSFTTQNPLTEAQSAADDSIKRSAIAKKDSIAARQKAIHDSIQAQKLRRGEWEQGNFIDEFGDKTGETYISIKIKNASFSNSATNNSRLTGNIVVKKKEAFIRLYEYGRKTPVRWAYDKPRTIVKSMDGTKHTIYTTEGENSIIYRGKAFSKLKSLMSSSETLSFSVTTDGSSSYLFKIDSKGFGYAYEEDF